MEMISLAYIMISVVFIACFSGNRCQAGPVSQCAVGASGSGLFVADSSDQCVFFWCLAGRWLQADPFRCPIGTGVAPGFIGTKNPCTVQDVGSCSQPYGTGDYQPQDPNNTPPPTDPAGDPVQDIPPYTGYQWKLPVDLNGWTVIEYDEDDDGGDDGDNQQLLSSSSNEQQQQQQQSEPWQLSQEQSNVIQLPSVRDDDERAAYYSVTAYLTPNSMVDGGRLATNANSAERCWKACVFNVQCKGFDFNTMSNQCYLHGDVTVCGRLKYQLGVNNYRLVKCVAAGPTYQGPPHIVESTPGVHVFGGTFQPNVRRALDCIQLCWATYRHCVGVDFDTNGNTCWFHSSATACNLQVQLATSTHYRNVGACDVNGYVIPGIHSLGGIYQPDFQDVMTCYRICSAIPSCQAIDFDSINNSCWFHGRSSCQQTEIRASTLQIRRVQSCNA